MFPGVCTSEGEHPCEEGAQTISIMEGSVDVVGEELDFEGRQEGLNQAIKKEIFLSVKGTQVKRQNAQK